MSCELTVNEAGKSLNKQQVTVVSHGSYSHPYLLQESNAWVSNKKTTAF